MPIKQKRNILTLSQKVSIVLEPQSGVKQAELCRKRGKRGLTSSTVSQIWQQRDRILDNSKRYSSNVKKARKCEFPEIDSALIQWLDLQRSRKLQINGPILLEKAKDFATRLNLPKFKGSQGWLEEWKNRHSIHFKEILGESGAVDDSVIEDWLTTVWPLIKEGYDLKDIFNVDESGFFFKLLTNKTMSQKGVTCAGGKLSKERISVLVGANADRSEKLKLLVIGKFENPRAFKNVKKRSLPVHYRWNTRSWMTKEIFSEWVIQLNLKMKAQNRKILLIIDNCPAHKVDDTNSHVKLLFLPPNVTAKLQPMDQGVINETKKVYRTRVIKKLIAQMDNDKTPKIDILDEIMIIASAWDSVPSQTIQNCFYHSKIISRPESEEIILIEVEGDDTDNSWRDRVDFGGATLEDYVHIDNDVLPYEVLGEDEIVGEILERRVSGNEQLEAAESDGEDDPEIPRAHVNSTQAENALETLKLWFMGQENSENVPVFNLVHKIERFLHTQKVVSARQAPITDFFPIQ